MFRPPNERERRFLLLLGILSIFISLAGDERIFALVNLTLGSDVIDKIFFGIFLPLFYLLPCIPLFLLLDPAERKTAALSLFAAFLSYFLASALKLVFARPRPFNVLEDVRIVGNWKDTTFSFPSSTTALAFGFSLPFFLHSGKRKLSYLLLFLSSSIGFFVVYTGYHWPLDACSGIWLAFGVEKLAEAVLTRLRHVCRAFLPRSHPKYP